MVILIKGVRERERKSKVILTNKEVYKKFLTIFIILSVLSYAFCLQMYLCVIDKIRVKMVGLGFQQTFCKYSLLFYCSSVSLQIWVQQPFVQYLAICNPLDIELFTPIFLYPGQQCLALLSIPKHRFQVSSRVGVSVCYGL